LPTDIKGANQAGIDSILLASGIHQEELAIDSQETVFTHYGARPTYLLNSLWRD
jgi:ribonucleotide monophosphatase NagD (HAD superfamily)